jgi:hypothetical protein
LAEVPFIINNNIIGKAGKIILSISIFLFVQVAFYKCIWVRKKTFYEQLEGEPGSPPTSLALNLSAKNTLVSSAEMFH